MCKADGLCSSRITAKGMDRSEVNMEKKWADLSPEEKREERFKRWLSPPGAKFAGPEYEKAYKSRVTRIVKAIKLPASSRLITPGERSRRLCMITKSSAGRGRNIYMNLTWICILVLALFFREGYLRLLTINYTSGRAMACLLKPLYINMLKVSI